MLFRVILLLILGALLFKYLRRLFAAPPVNPQVRGKPADDPKNDLSIKKHQQIEDAEFEDIK